MIDFNASQDTDGGASRPSEPTGSAAAIPPLPPNPEHTEHPDHQVDTQALAHQPYLPYTPPDAPTVEANRVSPPGAASYPYSGYSSYPNYANYPPYPQPPVRRRGVGPWIAVGGALLLVILIATFAFGRSVGNNSAGRTSSSGAGTGRTAATVAVPPAAQDLQQTVVNVIHTVQPSVVEVNSQWRRLDGCPATAATRTFGSITRQTWGPCRGASAVRLDAIQGGTHCWPTPTTCGNFDASKAFWSFLSSRR